MKNEGDGRIAAGVSATLAAAITAAALPIAGCGADHRASAEAGTAGGHQSARAAHARPRRPAGAATASDAAMRFITAQEAKDAARMCGLVTDAWLKDAAKVVGGSASDCPALMAKVVAFAGTPAVSPDEEHISVASSDEQGDTARVRVSYGVSPDSSATLQDNTVTVVHRNGRWLVQDSGG